jgi:hypothetical protein
MKILPIVVTCITAAVFSVGCEKVPAGPSGDSLASSGKDASCTTIPSGGLETSQGVAITPGYDDWGYNYQAYIFNGSYCDYHPIYRPGGLNHEWCQANYGDVVLVMKWNDAWLSNKDCDGDQLLDRHYGYVSYIGSGAWETNYMAGEYEVDGKLCKWNYFVKIIAVPEDATRVDGIWYNSEGGVIGPDIWGAFATVQEIENDPCAGVAGLSFASPDHPGFGGW